MPAHPLRSRVTLQLKEGHVGAPVVPASASAPDLFVSGVGFIGRIDSQTGEAVWENHEGTDWYDMRALVQHGEYVYTGTESGGRLQMWDAATGALLKTKVPDASLQYRAMTTDSDGYVYAAAFASGFLTGAVTKYSPDLETTIWHQLIQPRPLRIRAGDGVLYIIAHHSSVMGGLARLDTTTGEFIWPQAAPWYYELFYAGDWHTGVALEAVGDQAYFGFSSYRPILARMPPNWSGTSGTEETILFADMDDSTYASYYDLYYDGDALWGVRGGYFSGNIIIEKYDLDGQVLASGTPIPYTTWNDFGIRIRADGDGGVYVLYLYGPASEHAVLFKVSEDLQSIVWETKLLDVKPDGDFWESAYALDIESGS